MHRGNNKMYVDDFRPHTPKPALGVSDDPACQAVSIKPWLKECGFSFQADFPAFKVFNNRACRVHFCWTATKVLLTLSIKIYLP